MDGFYYTFKFCVISVPWTLGVFEKKILYSLNKFIHSYVRNKLSLYSIKKTLEYINEVSEMVVVWPFGKHLTVYQ